VAIRRDEQYEGFDWQRDAACRGEYAPHFFPPPHFEPKALRIARERTAKAICRQCPVSSECLAYALESREPHGVWGGLNEAERRSLLDGRGGSDDGRRRLNAVTGPDRTDRPDRLEPHERPE
jgi:WhiB family redox-sensing transcriptional regulator